MMMDDGDGVDGFDNPDRSAPAVGGGRRSRSVISNRREFSPNCFTDFARVLLTESLPLFAEIAGAGGRRPGVGSAGG